jgi:hypothetical protein
VLLAAALWLVPSLASGQTFGVRVGASGDPDQFFVGAHMETAPVAERIHFRPNIEIGIGENATVTALNFELAYKFPPRRPWRLYAGGGPALNLVHTSRTDHAEGGFNLLLGAEHHQGLFGEIKVGALDSPSVKITLGYVFH